MSSISFIESWFPLLSVFVFFTTGLLAATNPFPKYRTAQRNTAFGSLCALLGSYFKSGNQFSIQFQSSYPPLYWLIISIVALFIVVAIYMCLDEKDINYGDAPPALLTISLILIFGLALSHSGPEKRKPQITLQEHIILANHSEKRGNYERAIFHYEAIKQNTTKSQPIFNKANSKIEECQNKIASY